MTHAGNGGEIDSFFFKVRAYRLSFSYFTLLTFLYLTYRVKSILLLQYNAIYSYLQSFTY